MSAPRLSSLGRITAIGGGRIYVDSLPTPADEGFAFDVSADVERAYSPMLYVDGAVRVTIEPAPAPPEPLTGGDADINVRVRIKTDWSGGSFLGDKTGVIVEYIVDQHAVVRLDDGWHYTIPNSAIERAPTECPHCGASQVTR